MTTRLAQDHDNRLLPALIMYVVYILYCYPRLLTYERTENVKSNNDPTRLKSVQPLVTCSRTHCMMGAAFKADSCDSNQSKITATVLFNYKAPKGKTHATCSPQVHTWSSLHRRHGLLYRHISTTGEQQRRKKKETEAFVHSITCWRAMSSILEIAVL